MPIEFQVHVILQVAVWSFIIGLAMFCLGYWRGKRNPTPSPTFKEEVRRWEEAITEFHNMQSKVHRVSASESYSLAQFLSHELGIHEDEVLFWSLKTLSDMRLHHQRGEPAGYQMQDGSFSRMDHPFSKRISLWPHGE